MGIYIQMEQYQLLRRLHGMLMFCSLFHLHMQPHMVHSHFLLPILTTHGFGLNCSLTSLKQHNEYYFLASSLDGCVSSFPNSL